ncbi:MAG: MinD/ParA family protein [Bacillota bacterium]
MFDQASKLREMVKKDQNSNQQEPKKQKKTKTIAIASGKGGVGKSNITVNLGLALQEIGEDVLLIDADMGMANLDILLGLTQKYNLSHILQEKCSFSEALMKGPKDIDILPGTSGVEDFVNINQKEVGRLLNIASQMEANYDIILIDIGAGIHKSVLSFIVGADQAGIVLTPEPTAIMDAYSLIKILSKHKSKNRVGLVINQVESKKQAVELSDRMKSVIQEYLTQEISLMGFIPYDKFLKKSVQKQKPLLLSYPESKASKAIRRLARNLSENDDQKQAKGVKGFVYRLLGVFNRE